MDPRVLLILGAINALVSLRSDPKLADLKADVKELVGKLDAKLPKKPDGTPWTSADTVAAADAADAPWNAVEADASAPPAGN